MGGDWQQASASAHRPDRRECRRERAHLSSERAQLVRRREAPRPGFGSAPDEEEKHPDHLSAPVAPSQSAADLTKLRQRSRAGDAAAVTVVRCLPSAGFASFRNSYCPIATAPTRQRHVVLIATDCCGRRRTLSQRTGWPDGSASARLVTHTDTQEVRSALIVHHLSLSSSGVRAESHSKK
ncbi:hypothetical protein MRX96_030664 [Rhipicephalus microplus]